MAIPHEVVDALSSGMNGIGVLALTFLGTQMRKNRHAGRERDTRVDKLIVAVEGLTHAHTGLTREHTNLTREVDRDRAETRFMQESLKRVEGDLLRLIREKG